MYRHLSAAIVTAAPCEASFATSIRLGHLRRGESKEGVGGRREGGERERERERLGLGPIPVPAAADGRGRGEGGEGGGGGEKGKQEHLVKRKKEEEEGSAV